MTGNRIAARRTRNRRRALAIAAAGTVLAAAVTVPSLAAWTDTEWVTGGVGNTPGVGASTFEVEQFAASDTDWVQHETAGAPNVIDFSSAATSLTPGDTVYAYVRLRTTVGSLAGTVTLAAPTVVTPATLSAALEYGARVVPTIGDCSAASYAGAGTELQASGSALDATSGGTLSLVADGATVGATAEQIVCFQLTLPASFAGDSTIMGGTVTPVWRFDAVSI